ncbi:unnamed protein product [Heterobilharzia americana]|nr:unnamed protein product [Heterobilharzia americana]CAH8470447.1 unnamed protein product [Heterobilharzia americana]
MACKCPDIGWGVAWFLVFLLSLPVGFFCAFLFVIFSIFRSCFDACMKATDGLLKGAELPFFCMKKTIACEKMC